MHAALRWLRLGGEVIGLDVVEPPSGGVKAGAGRTDEAVSGLDDPASGLPSARLGQLLAEPGFTYVRQDIGQFKEIAELFAVRRPALVLHLAARTGVRDSLSDPLGYAQTNVNGFLNVLEACRLHPVKHLIYASSSSVYGGQRRLPFTEDAAADRPLTVYGATKKADELLAHSYSHLYGLPASGLRFFTVYGPWGRPDMALFKFAAAIVSGRPITLYNGGRMKRDFTYIDDVTESIVRLLVRPPRPAEGFACVDQDTRTGQADRADRVDLADQVDQPDEAEANSAVRPDIRPAGSEPPYRLLNVGHRRPVELTELVAQLEQALGRKADVRLADMQPGEMTDTWADSSLLEREIGFYPQTELKAGIAAFADWFKSYYHL
ncbi:hypothetical protein VN24_07115 [Paenibacillus beijingensis]|uniref:NAD-dependent epimerase/dehydratase domain-containing protein n=2 Tax=Paenibacillus beijingensis TaxID=1126833 RepID=A0A0D5NQT8_9BACL|nr:hypothetical protein VN24_07115 [Paenibacillus beijingensis]